MTQRLSRYEVDATWAILNDAPKTRTGQVATRASPWSYRGDPVLLGNDDQGRRHLLIPIGDLEQVAADRSSAGVHLLDRPLVEDGQLRRFLDVVCRKPHLDDLFSEIVAEIVESLGTRGRADQTVQGVLDRWRELLETGRPGAPSLEKLTGLFSELLVLSELAQHAAHVAEAWVGPDGERHDIVTPAGSVEVKGTRSRVGRQVEIHGVEQLEPPQSSELYLAYVRVERDPNGRSVYDLVAGLERSGCPVEHLRASLVKLGVTPEHEEAVRGIRFSVRERSTYVVGKGFPRIVRDSFPKGRVPDGVLSLSYAIDLSSEPPTPLSGAEWERLAAFLAASVR